MQLKRTILTRKQKKDSLGSSAYPTLKKLSPFNPALHGTLEDNLRRPHKLDILLQSTPPNEDIQECHSWKLDERLSNVTLKEDDKFTILCEYVHRSYFERFRGKMGYSRGFHVWQFHTREDHLAIIEVGMATKDVDVDSGKLLGYDSESFGWNKMLNKCRHNFPNFAAWRCPQMLEGVVRVQDEDEQFIISDNFYVILDMDEGFLAFATDDHYSGVAFRGLKGKTLYPIISAYHECEVTMKYLGGLDLSDETSPCICKSCTRIVISEYCKDCSAECVIDHVDKKVEEKKEAVTDE